MKSYALDCISSIDVAKAALNSALPGQSSPWLLRADDNDVIAYFNVIKTDVDLVGPAVTADISGRHYNEDRRVLTVLALIQKSVGGEIKGDS
jgi:hypothetical protein